MPSLGRSVHLARLEAESTNDLSHSLNVTTTTLASWEHDLEAPLREHLFRLSLPFPEIVDTFKEREGRG